MTHPIKSPKKRTYVATSSVFVVMLAGCSWMPWGTDKGDADAGNGDSGPRELEGCTLKLRACINTCMEADLGMLCKACCKENAGYCDEGRGYSFYSCPDKE
jgi:hypothetical protein